MLSVADPLARAYSHRDCELDPPLLHSLRHGFGHVEADVYCLLGGVFVAHDPQRLRPWRTLERLYLAPLRRHARASGGRVFADGTPLRLFVDVKTPSRASWRALERLLARYPDLVARETPDGFSPGEGGPGAVRVIVSGNRLPYDEVARLPLRHAALDGRLGDLGVHTDPRVMPVVSDDWRKHFRWRGDGPMPADERERLRGLLATAHRHGQKLRFWATPDRPGRERDAVWHDLLTLGIDLVNTDDVSGLAEYLQRTER